ncbi:MAG: hypothetical protein AUH82_01130 [Chloroflexi bacterium 13_1_40CM_4_65_13]|nr:MAG: hypothetical protein AUH82_01130 [Chloroflexi bacterium 13_1_40CM_4_65_13]
MSAQAGFPLKGEFYADILKAEPWFDFTEHWNEAHDALVFNTPVKGRLDPRPVARALPARQSRGQAPPGHGNCCAGRFWRPRCVRCVRA